MPTRGRPKSNSSGALDNSSSEDKANVENEGRVVTAKSSLGGSTSMKKDFNNQVLDLLTSLSERLSALENRPEAQERVVPKDVVEDDPSEEGDYEDEFDTVKINQEDYIKVISLNPFELNLSTEGGGKGRVYSFRTFGAKKRILYSDLVQILEKYYHFLEDGLFYIADKRVIRRHGLDEIYERILTENMIKKIINGTTKEDVVSIIKSASKGQHKVVAQMFIDGRLAGDEVDLNLWDKVERATGINMQEIYDSTREYLDSIKKTE